VVLVGERGTEQGHDAVTHDLVDGALVTMHRLDHARQHGVEQPARLLGVAVGQELHRALEVGEQHRHLFSLTLQRGSGTEDLLGDVLGCVVDRRGEARLESRGHRHRLGALRAELGVGRALVLAPRALQSGHFDPRLPSRPGSAHPSIGVKRLTTTQDEEKMTHLKLVKCGSDLHG
jgi:hypothetical protein